MFHTFSLCATGAAPKGWPRTWHGGACLRALATEKPHRACRISRVCSETPPQMSLPANLAPRSPPLWRPFDRVFEEERLRAGDEGGDDAGQRSDTVGGSRSPSRTQSSGRPPSPGYGAAGYRTLRKAEPTSHIAHLTSPRVLPPDQAVGLGTIPRHLKDPRDPGGGAPGPRDGRVTYRVSRSLPAVSPSYPAEPQDSAAATGP